MESSEDIIKSIAKDTRENSAKISSFMSTASPERKKTLMQATTLMDVTADLLEKEVKNHREHKV